jgi:hypothetical protein
VHKTRIAPGRLIGFPQPARHVRQLDVVWLTYGRGAQLLTDPISHD